MVSVGQNSLALFIAAEVLPAVSYTTDFCMLTLVWRERTTGAQRAEAYFEADRAGSQHSLEQGLDLCMCRRL